MKQINNFITEKLIINKNIKVNNYKYHPETKDELKELIEKRLEKDRDADLNDIDVSKIDDMSSLFSPSSSIKGARNIHIENWDVCNVTDMSEMFAYAGEFNCDISNWDVSNVKMMNYTFYNCECFNCDLSKWDVGKVKRWNNVFGGRCGIKEEYKPKFNWKNVK